ncbi:MAG TPA: DUF1177 domain-containing protein [Chloroflexota bacterium]|nr:DUF1177 domain-containing protein [Chloroflexota bacterium]
MALRQSIEVLDLLGRADVDGQRVADLLHRGGVAHVETERVAGAETFTDFVRVRVLGTGGGPTLGIIGRLGGIGARPGRAGLVSDADGAAVALASALVLSDLVASGDRLAGDVLIATHVCPHAPVIPHDPVPFMGSPVDQVTKNRHEVDPRMAAILSVDTTRGNRLVNRRGFAITPTVKQGWILRVSESLLDLQGWVTGRLPLVLPITTQDLTPYGNDLFHLNSILQPSTATTAPLVGVALTSESTVPGCATGVSSAVDVEEAVRFCVEVAKAFGQGTCQVYDADEWARIAERYGPLSVLQTAGRGALEPLP